MKTNEVEIEFPNFEKDDFLKFNNNHSCPIVTRYVTQRNEIEEDSQIQGLLANISKLIAFNRFGLV